MVKFFSAQLILILLISCSSPFHEKKQEENAISISPKVSSEENVTNSGEQPENNVITEKERQRQMAEITKIMAEFPELSTYEIFKKDGTILITGDFFGDQSEDIAFLVKDTKEVKICVINKGSKDQVFLLGNTPDDVEGITDYNWVGDFETVPEGKTLWSNYDDDFREFDDVPEKEKVRLKYDAIYVHAAESCGGGFIFRKNDKWNWLQQE